MNQEYLRHLPTIFSGPVLSEIARSGYSHIFGYILRESGAVPVVAGQTTLREIFESVYSLLRHHYRCEYVFKNAIATKILLGRHSPRTASLFQEFRVGRSKADVVVINGTSTVYEIKTSLDNLDRLVTQLEDYQKVFDRICVVTESGQQGKIADAVDDGVGIVVLTNRYTLRSIREARSNSSNIDPATIFDSLREAEQATILRTEFGEVPSVPNGIRYQVFRERFASIPADRAHRQMVRALAGRVDGARLADYLPTLPQSLTAAVLGAGFSERDEQRFREALDAPLGVGS